MQKYRKNPFVKKYQILLQKFPLSFLSGCLYYEIMTENYNLSFMLTNAKKQCNLKNRTNVLITERNTNMALSKEESLKSEIFEKILLLNEKQFNKLKEIINQEEKSKTY